MTRLLEGVRVFELGIAIASPNAGRTLAFHGAEVFKVESPTSPDVVRLIGSAWLRDDEERAAAWPDSSPYVPEMNANKRSVALDLKHPGGRDAARRLLASCDVFLANFGARALADLGLDYESVRAIRPDIVYVHLPGLRVRPRHPLLPVRGLGPEPGAAGRARRPDRPRRTGAGRHRHRGPARLPQLVCTPPSPSWPGSSSGTGPARGCTSTSPSSRPRSRSSSAPSPWTTP